jgi:thiol-disulfide isomerase/thioredoxin
MPYKNTVVSLILLFTIIGCTTKSKSLVSISGTLLNLKENKIILSKVEDIQQKQTMVIDTLMMDENGNFYAEYNLNSGIYTLHFDHKKKVQLAIEKGQHITINGTNLDSLTIDGSVDTQLLINYETFRKASLNRLVYSVRRKIKMLKKQNAPSEEIIKLRDLEVENYKKHLTELTVFIQENMGTSIAIYPTSIRWNTDNLTAYKQLVANFKIAHPNLYITRKLENRIEILQKTAIGSSILDIEMPNANNKIVKLSSLKSQYILVDFWASWCPPCRTESKLLYNLYEKYHSKGFEIYGISLDSKKQRWLDAIQKDKRIWIEVSTIEGFKTHVAQEFGITALPTNFLINAQGKIIATNIHGNELEKTIQKLFE